ncbi:MAG: response regulator [Chloroherpetonaceae bacterium]|nr:response regulator [Chloroherpetonaceae bacterium]
MKKSILIIDDQPDMLFMLRRVLGDDFEVIEKTDGASALSWLAEGNKPDMIISDLTMPSMNGIEFLRLVRQMPLNRYTPLVIVSAQSDIRLKLKAFEVGANEYIVKPVHPNELLMRVRNIFNLIEPKKE